MLTACVLINTLVSQDSVKKFRFQKWNYFRPNVTCCKSRTILLWEDKNVTSNKFDKNSRSEPKFLSYLLSELFTALMKASNFCLFVASSPKLTMSTATWFFFIRAPSLTSSCSVALTGLPTNMTIRCSCRLF
jgi:hypothetical protein